MATPAQTTSRTPGHHGRAVELIGVNKWYGQFHVLRDVDLAYFGGGTHENLQGQDLDAHIDFNYHPLTRQHRRLNLIIYLNEQWQDEWGGSLQLHRDPTLPPQSDEIVTVTPLLNRCVIFETSERSWHGFRRIDLPADRQQQYGAVMENLAANR